MSDSNRSETHAAFPATRWSEVARAGRSPSAEALSALESLCRAYWFPIYAFIRRRGNDPDAACDLAQSYFTRLIEKGTLAAADPAKGRFRSFLRTDCTFFLANERDRQHAQKRGGRRTFFPLEARDAEDRYLREPAHELTPERLFDRTWSLGLLDRVVEQLSAEYTRAGRSTLFEHLQVVLTGEQAVPYAALADQLDTTERAIQTAVWRLRTRYRAILREQIAATLDNPTDAEVDDEIRALFAALGR
jgi:DNA-directed RNA polymerase specialized sigma24 family protein